MQNEYILKFAFARTALKYGLHVLSLQAGDCILIPDYICDVVLRPVKKFGLEIIVYPVTDNLCPDWDAIGSILNKKKADAVLLIHYFGQPQGLERFRTICDEYNLRLIEDNAHGHGGCLHGHALGTFGDIGISSPRKMLGLASGGLLYYRGSRDVANETLSGLPRYPSHRPIRMLKKRLNRFPRMKGRIRGLCNIARNWSDPLAFRESEEQDYQIDQESSKRIEAVDWGIFAKQRRDAWQAWDAFACSRGLERVFASVAAESCPWAMPVYAHDMAERNYWLRWGARHGVSIFPWPSLPEEIIEMRGSALKRWQRLLCFPLDQLPVLE